MRECLGGVASQVLCRLVQESQLVSVRLNDEKGMGAFQCIAGIKDPVFMVSH